MTYKVVPFTAKITRTDTVSTVASQIQNIIDEYVKNGWTYHGLEVVETSVAPTAGCFGLGALPGYNTAFQMLVFVKN